MTLKSIRPKLKGILYDTTVEEEAVRKMRQKSSSASAIFVGLVAAMGGFLYGYDTGLINGIMEMSYVKQEIPSNHTDFNVHERALVTAILSMGTFVGALAAPLISDSYGRKFSIILSAAVIFNVGNTFQVAATDVAFLCAGRAISGLAVGILSAIVPLYQAEASPKWVRGSIVFTYQWAITWGLLIALAVCQGTRKINSSASYRIPIGVQYLWSIVLCVGMLFLPESPRYYVQKDNIQGALDSLIKLRRLPQEDPDLIEELVEIKANYDYEMSFGRTTYLDCFRLGGARHKQGLRMLTGMGVQLFQQCSGINFIFYYGVNFFASTGVENYYLMSFVTYLVNVIFTVPGIIFIDIIGRRRLLLIGGIGMALSNTIIAIVGVTMSSHEASSIVSIALSCCFIACFASSWGGCTWAICSDIYGISIRQKAVSITASTNWLVNFVFAYITPYLIDTGEHTAALGNKIFFIWGGCNALGVVFVYFMVYETKGLKLEEVDFMYQICKNSRASTKFKSRRFDFSSLLPDNGIINSLVNSPHNEWADPNLQDKMESNSFSDTSDDSDSSAASNTATDYQNYLRNLHEQDSANSRHTLTSFTSASILRGPMSLKQQGHKPRTKSVISTMSNAGKAMGHSGSILPATSPLNEPISLNLDGSGNMKIIAAPFYNEPPSDSDSDE
ncbi:hypothetical protein METBIDRAFT_36734 [Metschnikowia bicuspidata var. bicuspidata NRRL YB-4993]|uniref:Major facilitator superfamily (MFS) profile domain-containing protein n=1 Tax=Metschnikowia bicuspidata var. bicuspidata NRRL YB-4993 TaxID=869754 RepID=A0A1A0HJQ5_9ASCO|nr:hypothetical protein METBIDRAFT_36734 [Metschnikowia bicuspidata var. bicuspidata NRRL YB-4993]OBA24250.1 hypothetical protein METBIDRAFT_36734 [Metschnikowia bicuspidata var. bicuspidata NRRL YB-4993]